MTMVKQGQKLAKEENIPAPKEQTTGEILQPRVYSPKAGDLLVPKHRRPPIPLTTTIDNVTRGKPTASTAPEVPAEPTPAATTSNDVLGPADQPKIYYPKEKRDNNGPPGSAPFLPRGESFTEVPEQYFDPPPPARKVSSTPKLRGDEPILSGIAEAADEGSSPAPSEVSAETPQEEYFQPLPKVDGIILGSHELSLTRKGTCGTRGVGKLVVPERKISSSHGSIRNGDEEDSVCGSSSSTVTAGRTSSEDNTEVSLPGQTVTPSLKLPPRPPTPLNFEQHLCLQSANSQNRPFPRGTGKSRGGGQIKISKSASYANTARPQAAPSFPRQPFSCWQRNNKMSSPAPVTQDAKLAQQPEQPEPGNNSKHAVISQQLTVAEDAPQNELVSCLKSLSEDVNGIKAEQLKISKHLEDINNHLKGLSGDILSEKDARAKSLAAHEKNINSHITEVVGVIGEAVDSVAVMVANISDKASNIGSANFSATEGGNFNWPDAVQSPDALYGTQSDQVDDSQSAKRNGGAPTRRARSQTDPAIIGHAAGEQGQQRGAGANNNQATQKKGFWKRNNSGSSRRGGPGNNGHGSTSSFGNHPSQAVMQAGPEPVVGNPYAYSQPQVNYEEQQPFHQPAPGPSVPYGQAPVQHRGFPPRGSSMRQNNGYTRGGAKYSSNRNYAQQQQYRDLTPNYASPPAGQPQFQFNPNAPVHVHQGQQWQPQYDQYKPWGGVSNWYQQVYQEGNDNPQNMQN
ncbi:hypothetical protein AJ79_02414 [Helicocarpus griseus UAMH5409]|uniref:Uncharacterized protein n=1 Tax=Helicocarpus griseus UAMH5409 TaxID=1447875 RepID=A0A2B7Y3N6_9EURO|nr:hypothetical protein AJ79_02414 [Helicocarpus griseus UAMH5409]